MEHLTPKIIAQIIKTSGCSDIQAAARAIEEQGFNLADLDPQTLQEVLAVMASAAAVDAQAAPTKPSKPTTQT